MADYVKVNPQPGTTIEAVSFGQHVETQYDCAKDEYEAGNWSKPSDIGDVNGPGSSTDNAIPRFHETGGKTLQDSVVTIDDTTGAIKINAHQALSDPTGSPSGKFLKDDGTWGSPAGGGDVTGPGSSTDNAIPRFDGAGGKTLQDSVVTVDDTTGAVKINAHQAITDPGASPSGKFLKDNGTWDSPAGGGDVTGPGSSTDNALTRFHSDSGKVIQNSTATLDDNGTLNIPSGQAYKINGTALAYGDVGAAASSHNHAATDINSGTLDGDILPALSASKKGGCPATGTPSGKFLKDNGTWESPAGAGDVVGPGSSTDNAIARFDGATGKAIQDSVVTIDDTTGAMKINSHQAISDPTGSPSGKFLKDDGTWDSPAGAGDVVGPAGATNNHIARYDTTTGKLLQDSLVDIDDSGSLNIPSGQSFKINGSGLAYSDVGAAASSHAHAGSEITSGTLDGDRLPALSSTKKGGAPATGTPSGKYLKDNGTWDTPAGGSGDVVGPSSATDNAIPRFDSTTGKLIQDSVVTIDDTTGVVKINAHQAISDPGASPSGKYLKDNGQWDSPAGAGDVVGPSSATDNAIARFDNTTGKLIQNGLATVDDSGSLNIPSGQHFKVDGSNLAYSDVGAAPSPATVAHGGTGQTTCAKGDMFVGSGSNTVGKQSVGSNGTVLKANSGEANGVEWASVLVGMNFIIDGGGNAITTGQKGHIEIPFAGTITGWTIMADQSGSIVVDVWKDTYANFPPTVADTIAGSEKPTLSSAQKNQDLSLTTWTDSISAGDILAFNVDSAETVQRVTVALQIRRS